MGRSATNGLLIRALLLVHIVEIWIFAAGIMFAEWHGGLGEVMGNGDHQLSTQLSSSLLEELLYARLRQPLIGRSQVSLAADVFQLIGDLG